MQIKKIYYRDVTESDWDFYVNQFSDATYHHSWSWINYLSFFSNVISNSSFILVDESQKALSLCSLGISFNAKYNFNEISFGGNSCGVPLVLNEQPSFRRKLLDLVIGEIISLSNEFDVKKLNFISNPITNNLIEGNYLSKNNFELLRYQFHYSVENTLLIDLSLESIKLFENVSKYQRRHIRQTEKKGVEIEIFNKESKFEEVKKAFLLFQDAHFLSAGKITRPQSTWDSMMNLIIKNKGTLFTANIDGTPISYLFCGEHSRMAFGWSQVNLEEYEWKYSPRHLLEWSAIMYYKSKNFKFYEIGIRHFGAKFTRISTDKEISISVFKERYGGFMMPSIKWSGFLDKQILIDEYSENLALFISENPTLTLPKP